MNNNALSVDTETGCAIPGELAKLKKPGRKCKDCNKLLSIWNKEKRCYNCDKKYRLNKELFWSLTTQEREKFLKKYGRRYE